MKVRDRNTVDNEDIIFPEDHKEYVEEQSKKVEKKSSSKDGVEYSDFTEALRNRGAEPIKFKQNLDREDEIADLDLQLSELEGMSKSKFNLQKRKEIEAHRRELVKAQQQEVKEQIKLAEAKRKEEERHVKWSKRAIDAETQTRIAEERQREALTKDRRKRARRRRVDRIFDIIGKILFGVFLLVAILIVSNETVRDRIAININNLGDLLKSWTSGEGTPSNKTVDDALKDLGTELNDINTFGEPTSTGEGYDVNE